MIEELTSIEEEPMIVDLPLVLFLVQVVRENTENLVCRLDMEIAPIILSTGASMIVNKIDW